MGGLLEIFILFLAVLTVLTTFLPTIRTSTWWIRACDFPRAQLLVLTVVLLAALSLITGFDSVAAKCAATALLITAAWQLNAILPYTSLVAQEVGPSKVTLRADGADADRCVTLLACNVEMDNRDPSRLLAMIKENAPDIVFLAEVDDWWLEQLAPLRAHYPTFETQPQDNYYGLAFTTGWRFYRSSKRWILACAPSSRTIFPRSKQSL